MLYKEVVRIEHVKKTLEIIAYLSLAIDFAIAAVTLVSINTGSFRLSDIQLYLNYALTGEVVVTSVLFVLLAYLSHYQKIIDNIVLFHKHIVYTMSKGKRGRRGSRRVLGIF